MGQASKATVPSGVAVAVPMVCAKLPQEVLGTLQPKPQVDATPGATQDKCFLSITLPPGPTGHTHTVHSSHSHLAFTLGLFADE